MALPNPSLPLTMILHGGFVDGDRCFGHQGHGLLRRKQRQISQSQTDDDFGKGMDCTLEVLHRVPFATSPSF